MSDDDATNDALFDFVDEVLAQHFGSEYTPTATMDRTEVERLLTDDTRRRVEEARRAALEWGRSESPQDVTIASDRLVITSHGLIYAAGITAGNTTTADTTTADTTTADTTTTLYYLATPIALFESMVERVDAIAGQQGSIAAVDDRFGDDLTYPWPLDVRLRHILDANRALHLDLWR